MSGNNKISVLFLNHWAKNLGGAEHSLLELLEHSVRHFKCYLVSSENGALIEKAEKTGVSCAIVKCGHLLENIRRWRLLASSMLYLPAIFSFITFVIRLKRHVSSIRPDLIHANIPKSHIALFLLSRMGYKGVCCFHIREIFNSGSLPFFVYQTLFSPKKSAVIAISNAVKEKLPLSMQEKSVVIYNGIHIPTSLKKMTPRERLRLLFLGRIVPWKGCHFLIDIIYYIVKNFPSCPVELSIIGDTIYWPNSYRNELKKKIESLGLSELCGLYPHTDNPFKAYSENDIFCNASLQEPFGRSIAEAQGCGLPVIAFNGGGIEEIVEHEATGFLVPYGDNEAFCRAIVKFSNDFELIKKMGMSARRKISEKFNREIQGGLFTDYILKNVASK